MTATMVLSVSQLLYIILYLSAGQLGVQHTQLLAKQITLNQVFESGL